MAAKKDDLTWAGLVLQRQCSWYGKHRDELMKSQQSNDCRLVRCFNWLSSAGRNKGSDRLLLLWSAFSSLYGTRKHYVNQVAGLRPAPEVKVFQEFVGEILRYEAPDEVPQQPSCPRAPEGSWLGLMAENCRKDILALMDCKLADQGYFKDLFGLDKFSRKSSYRNKVAARGNGDPVRSYDEQHDIRFKRFAQTLAHDTISHNQINAVLGRIYFLRGHVAHGAVGPYSGLHKEFIAASNVISSLTAIIVQVILENPRRDWGDSPVEFEQATDENQLQTSGIIL